MKTMVGVLPSEEEATCVTRELKALGIASDEIMIADGIDEESREKSLHEGEWSRRNLAAVAASGFGWLFAGLVPVIAESSRRRAVAIGGSFGGFAGIVAALIALSIHGHVSIPGSGSPGVQAAVILGGLLVGGLGGSLVTGIYSMGVSHEEVPLCEEAFREHGVVVSIHVDDRTEPGALKVLNEHHARSLRTGADAWVASGLAAAGPVGEKFYPSDSSFKSSGDVSY